MDKVRIFALGGLDEDGKNMYVVACEYVYMPGTKHEIYCGGDGTMEVYWDIIEKFLIQ